MTYIPHSYSCTICRNPRSLSNNWILGTVRKLGGRIWVAVRPWDDKIARQRGVSHLCGVNCMVRWASREFEGLAAAGLGATKEVKKQASGESHVPALPSLQT